MSTTTASAIGYSPAALARLDLSTRQAITLAGSALTVVATLDIVIDGRIGLLFSVGFVLIAITTPLSVDRRSLFGPAILPPLLMLAAIVLLSIVLPTAIPADTIPVAGVRQRVLTGIVGQATALAVGHLLALGIVGLRILGSPDDA